MATLVLKGHWIGNTANLYKQTEDSARVGVNYYLTVAAQIASISNVISISEEVFETLKFSLSTSTAFLTKSFLYITPVIVNALCYKFDLKNNPSIKRFGIIVNTYFGSICNLVITTSSIALIYLGNPFLGYTSLAWVIVGFIQRRCLIPVSISEKINSIGFVGTNIARIALGDYSHKLLAIVEIANLIYSKIVTSKKTDLSLKKAAAEISITDNFGFDSLQINYDHLRYRSSLKKPPEIDIRQLKDIFQKFELKNPAYFKTLKKAVLEDEHWKEYYIDKDKDDEIIEYIKSGLDNFINNVSNRTIKSGEITDYRSLQNRTKHITHTLLSSSKEDQFINIVRLALASYYCPAGYIEKVRSVYYTVCSSVEEDSINSRIFQVLDDARKYLLQSFLFNLHSENSTFVKPLLDPNDIHIYNEFINFLGEKFNLKDVEDATQDSLSYLDVLSKKILQLMYKPLIRPYLQKYDKKYIGETMSEAITNNQIPFELINRWYIDEYLSVLKSIKLEKETEKKYSERRFKEAEKWVQENVFDIMTGKIKEKYFLFLLIKMGIFHLPNS